MNVNICVGSSCHIKGSHDIIQLAKEAITKYNLEDKINLSAAFCLGKCTDGVSIKVNDEIICGVSKENFPDFFQSNILSKLQ
ncbi:NAD(P)H-dependent oxidoreductase subunit E [Mobilitalea sibirica]|nr:NAD(P)H-dependent oxidoreductase subunit E [Mobilitalea sibirica]